MSLVNRRVMLDVRMRSLLIAFRRMLRLGLIWARFDLFLRWLNNDRGCLVIMI